MNEFYNPPNIAFFNGLYPANYDMDQMFTNQLLEHANAVYVPEPPVEYKKNPPVFTSIDTWPQSTTLRCGNCNLQFDGMPFVLLTDTTPTGGLATKYNFCHFFCVESHIRAFDYPDRLKWKYRKLLYEFHHRIIGQRVSYISAAPNPLEMVQYGGNISPAEYKKKIELLAQSGFVYS